MLLRLLYTIIITTATTIFNNNDNSAASCNAELMYIFSADRFPDCFDFITHQDTEMRITLVSASINETFWLFEKDLYYPSTTFLVINGTRRLNFSYKEARFFEGRNEDMSLEADVTVTPVLGQGHHVSVALLHDKVGNPNTMTVYEVMVVLNHVPPFLCPHGVLSTQQYKFSDLLDFDFNEEEEMNQQSSSDKTPTKWRQQKHQQQQQNKLSSFDDDVIDGDDVVFTIVKSGDNEDRDSSKQPVLSECRQQPPPQRTMDNRDLGFAVVNQQQQQQQSGVEQHDQPTTIRAGEPAHVIDQRNMHHGESRQDEGESATPMSFSLTIDNNIYSSSNNNEKPASYPYYHQRHHHHHQRVRRSDFKSMHSIDNSSGPFHLELFISIDHTLYTLFNKDYKALTRRTQHIVNQVDTIFRQHNIRVHLAGMEVWSNHDRIQFTKDSGFVLDEFSSYTALKRFADVDHVHLLSGRHDYFDGAVVGKAYHDLMCSHSNSAGLTTDSPDHIITRTATIMAHELGHNLGMLHDVDERRCVCAEPHACIMSSNVATPSPRFFSACSIRQLHTYLGSFKSKCLFNKPSPANSISTNTNNNKCGNNIVDDGEDCDCGDPYFCNNPCCDPHTCRYTRYGAQCFEGACCTKECTLKPTGTICRKSTGDLCDLPDRCDGFSSDCRDIYKENGVRCAGNGDTAVISSNGICHEGQCRSHHYQCEKLWGRGAKKAHDECYNRVNRVGSWFGHCGAEISGSKISYTKCSVKNTMCGVLQCTDRPNTYPVYGWRTAYGEVTLIKTKHQCQMAQYGVGGRGEQEPCKYCILIFKLGSTSFVYYNSLLTNQCL